MTIETSFFYLRRKPRNDSKTRRGHPVGVIMVQENERGHLEFATARCSEKDVFRYVTARNIVKARMNKKADHYSIELPGSPVEGIRTVRNIMYLFKNEIECMTNNRLASSLRMLLGENASRFNQFLSVLIEGHKKK